MPRTVAIKIISANPGQPFHAVAFKHKQHHAHESWTGGKKPDVAVTSTTDSFAGTNIATLILENGARWIIGFAHPGDHSVFVLACFDPLTQDQIIDLRERIHLAVSGRYFSYNQESFSRFEHVPMRFAVEVARTDPPPSWLLPFYGAVLERYSRSPRWKGGVRTGRAYRDTQNDQPFIVALLKGESVSIEVSSDPENPVGFVQRSEKKAAVKLIADRQITVDLEREPTTEVKLIFQKHDGMPAPARQILFWNPKFSVPGEPWAARPLGPFTSSTDADGQAVHGCRLLQIPDWSFSAVEDCQPPHAALNRVPLDTTHAARSFIAKFPPVPATIAATVSVSIAGPVYKPAIVSVAAYRKPEGFCVAETPPITMSAPSSRGSDGSAELLLSGGYEWLFIASWTNFYGSPEDPTPELAQSAVGTSSPLVEDATFAITYFIQG